MNKQIRTDQLKYYVVKTRANRMTDYNYFTDKGTAERFAKKHNTKIDGEN